MSNAKFAYSYPKEPNTGGACVFRVIFQNTALQLRWPDNPQGRAEAEMVAKMLPVLLADGDRERLLDAQSTELHKELDEFLKGRE